MTNPHRSRPVGESAKEARARAALAAARAVLSVDASVPFHTLKAAGAYQAKRDAALRANAVVVDNLRVGAFGFGGDLVEVAQDYAREHLELNVMDGQFSPADLEANLRAALHVLRDPPKQYRSNSASLAAVGPHLDPDAEASLECALGGIEQRLSDLALARENDELGGHLPGVQLAARRDTVRERRPKTNADEEYRARAKLREAARHDPSAFARAVPADICDRVTPADSEEAARDLLNAALQSKKLQEDTRPGIAWLRSEALPALKSGASTLETTVFANLAAGDLVIAGYKPPAPRTPYRAHPGLVIGWRAVCGEHAIESESLDDVIAAGTAPVARCANGVVIGLRKRELPERPACPPKAKAQTFPMHRIDPASYTQGGVSTQ